MVQKPNMFPRQRPTGCPRRPLVPHGTEAGEAEEWEALAIEEKWRRLAYCMEGELCRECDFVGEGGNPTGPTRAEGRACGSSHDR